VLAFARAVKDLLRSVREAARQLRDWTDPSFSHHVAIYDAVAASDAAAAEAAMQRHMDVVQGEQEAAVQLLDDVAQGKTGLARGRLATHARRRDAAKRKSATR
jgi:DNA-binding FadR family transcriptional regulator